ncbi:VPDSG-CTERM exosortase interaction domain protein [Schaalia sp. 19OD2882]|uniref:VPDSG-CTERM exosortase interaction domain protein n=1 Tax=Schaalia sp. 19OD2882 TaxID=2794089 RepID=UPI001C1EE41B|nr:VPDSG-CTERM exosortase interaction domain protein [Schaalia sp. 19OD2882]QWW19137.1 VPDSG-CTERM exosortase interaction domain protein [Schaalia sp. 19OD2882]
MGVGDALSAAWRKALDVPYELSLAQANALRRKYPRATPANLVELAHRRFARRVSAESAAAGGAAVLPGVGTAVSLGASSVQLLAFVSEAAVHALTVAHLHGIDLRDPAKRHALVLAVLTGQEGAELISAQVGIQAVSWFRSSFLDIRTVSAQRFNDLMLMWVRKRAASSALKGTVGRMIPFGIGAAVGWGIGAGLARGVVDGLNLALGPAPHSFIEGVAVEVDTTDEGEVERRFAHLRLPGVSQEEETR